MKFDFSLKNLFDRKKFGAPNFQMPQIQQPGPTTIDEINANKMMPSMRPSPFGMQQNQPLPTPALDEYKKYMGGMPQRGNENIWTKLAAAMGGASSAYFKGPQAGLETAVGIRDMGYNRKMAEWESGLDPRSKAAQIESMNLGRENSAERNQVTDRYNQGRLNIAQQNLGLTKMKLEQGNWDQVDVTESGNPILINKIDGTTKILTDVDVYSPKEKYTADLEAAMARVETAQAGALQRTRESNATSRGNAILGQEGQDRRQQNNFDFELENPDIEPEDRPNTSWEKYQDDKTNAALAAQHPEWMGKVLFNDPKNGKVFPIRPEQSNRFWNNSAEKEAAYQAYRTEYDNVRSSSVSTRPKTPTKRNNQSEMIEMIGPGGDVIRIPANMEAEAAKDKYRRK